MTVYGDSIEAYLRLNTTSFDNAIDRSIKQVELFKSAVLEVSSQSDSLVTGFTHVSQAVKNLVMEINLLDNESTQSVKNFKTLAQGMNYAAEAAQRMTTVAERGGMGIEALNSIIKVFNSGMENAELRINLTASALNRLNTEEGVVTSQSSRMSDSFKRAYESLMQISRGIPSLNNVDTESNKVKQSVRMMDVEFKRAKEDLLLLGQGIPSLNRIDTMSNKVKESVRMMDAEFKRAKADLLAIGQGALEFNRIDATSNKVKSQMALMNAEFEKSKAFLEQMAFTGVEAFNKVETGVQEAKRQMQLYEAQVQSSSVKAQMLWNQNTSSINRTTSATQRATTATNSFGKALSSLKTIGTLVGSMMVYNLAHNLISATRETVNAKSEMEGYFKMLNFSQKEVDGFNNALDQTVKQFQRVNKYSLGETISSIGVEFNLSTKEMEKAMKVTSMVTSEYLRAGRNANEASLAVKDVLQGQFQRLSRETGVKGEQLKEAGWSGDTNDVLSLMEALEKVGESRNWDVFAEKANSLNDMVIILQNRFGEWSAEMVNVVQPSIVASFNAIMSVTGLLGDSLGRVWEWVNGDGLVNQAVKWTGIATAITSVITALVHYRTGATLTQMVQMGLRGSIIATTLGLKAEEVATYGSRNAIVSKITSLKVEQVALMGVRNALLSKVLGLDAEVVATMGLKGAIGEEILARRLQEAQIKGATVQQKMHIVTEYEEQMAKRSTLSAIFAKIAGVEMETFAEKGLIVALAQRIATSPLYIGSLEAEEVAELSTAEASLLLAGTLAPLVAIFVGLAVAVYSVVKPLQDASAEMKAFNNVVDNADSIMKNSYATQKQYRDEVSKLKDSLANATEGTKKYARIQDKLNTATQNYAIAQQNVKTNIEAVNLARNSKDYYNNKKEEIARDSTIQLANAYIKAGYSATEASEMASSYYRDAEQGAKQLKDAINTIAFEDKRRQSRTTTMLDYLKKYDAPKEKVKELVGNLNDAHDKIAEGLDRFMTSDDLMERLGGWLEIQEGRFEAWWTEMNGLFEVRDWNGMFNKIREGFLYVWEMFPWNDMLASIGQSIQDKGLINVIMDALFGEGDSDGMIDIISQFLNDTIIQPVGNWIAWFMQDPSAHFEEVTDDLSLSLAKFLFGKNETNSVKDITDQWMKDVIVKPLMDSWNDFCNNPLEFIGNNEGVSSFGGLGALIQLLFGTSTTLGDLDGIFQSIFEDYLLHPLQNFLGSIADFLGGASGDKSKTVSITDIVKNTISWTSDELSQLASDIVGLFRDALVNGIKSIPVVSSIADLLGLGENPEQDAQDKGTGIGNSFNTGISTGLSGVDAVLNGFLSRFDITNQGMQNTASDTSTNVSGSYNQMKNNQKTSLESMVSKSSSAMNSIKTDTANKLATMRDSTSQITSQMTSAWGSMKDSILDSAKRIRDGASERFSGLSKTIGDFYAKIRDPSKWGAGYKSWSRSPRPSALKRVGVSKRNIGSKHGAGYNPYSSSPNSTMHIRDLIKLVDSDEEVNVGQFLGLFTGGFGGWDFANPHKTYIKNQSDKWNTARAIIRGIGSVGNEYKVERFNGTPHFRWEEFMATARDIFSAIPYKFYYDSEWKGNWVSALLSGATNCSDGSDALLALASLFGFSGSKVHTTLKNGTGHYYTVINGRKMDTTNFQHNRSWSPLGGAGTTRINNNRQSGSTTNEFNIHINGDVYGMDDFKSKMREASREVMREEFNDPFGVAI